MTVRASDDAQLTLWRDAQKACSQRVHQYILEHPSCCLSEIAIACLGGSGAMRCSETTKARLFVCELEERGVVRRVPLTGSGTTGRPIRYFCVM